MGYLKLGTYLEIGIPGLYCIRPYGIYRGAVVGLRGAVVGVRGAAVGVRGAAVGNIGIPTYVISRGAVVRQPLW